MTKQECINLLLDSGHYQRHNLSFCKSGRYTLRHGEYSRPEYRIIKRRNCDDYFITAKYFFYPGTFNTPKNGPLSTDGLNNFYYCINMKRSEGV